jgi:hypothetical protein
MILAAAGLTIAEDADEFSILLPILLICGWRAKYSPPAPFSSKTLQASLIRSSENYPAHRSLKKYSQFDDRGLFTFVKIDLQTFKPE